ncbi:inositol 2-dehydrogenase [Ligilactobacillus salivarius]|uniref:Inositol 2-dehydrogenase n=2 Tax=Bacteria TaxID=2 RepID=A0A2A2X234_9LACO|nr:inositol 2-dehydrogenase [Ligilactobacillus salivarius]HIX53746.1 inositol 2-dehydrogenase [Candidatus Sphingobacterium stercoripullorum]MDN4834319.1 inositol 2-dehydrogenase [Ligilactobacillus salivarius]MDO5005007.1 inositol 2-dehydrogenase [Ligilactobacillus salivarius]MYY64967.1 inositol 2-dehydrogenase [Ligilactobacillus salivarius]PAY52584.1 inositol 2-dehydrogenase [Ligilactobacillus salivarius]
MSLDKKINVAIIGVGRIGSIHFKNLKSNDSVNIKYLCDIAADDSWKKKYEGYTVITDYEEVLSDSSVDAVLICTPTDLHPAMVSAAAKAGKNIFCEKPLGFDMNEILNSYEDVKKSNIIMGVGFNRRFDKNFYRIVEHRQLGNIGEPQVLKITSRDPEPPSIDYVKHSGGLFMDMMIHDFDMARFIPDHEITEVYATGANLIDPAIADAGDIDTAIVTLTYDNGMIGVIDNSRQAVYGYDQRIELFGSKGMAKANNVNDTTTEYYSSEDVQSDKPMFFFLQRYMDAYKSEIEQFISLVEGKEIGDRVLGSYEDGIKAIKLAEAAAKSLRDKKPVKIEDL